MPINNAKHLIEAIDGVRCTIVEKGVTKERLAFLKNLLEFNKLEVRFRTDPVDEEGSVEPPAFTIGVTDIIFNPVFAIYERQLKTQDGFFVTPAIWKQETTEYRSRYWEESKK